jgi:hypothetical protein
MGRHDRHTLVSDDVNPAFALVVVVLEAAKPTT